MKNKILVVGLLATMSVLTSCKKCAECHYDTPNGIVEIGEYCGNELEDIEKSGYNAEGKTYEVHCHDH